MQGTFQLLTVIMGDKRISEEKEFLEALCQRKGDTIYGAIAEYPAQQMSYLKTAATAVRSPVVDE